MRSLVVLGMLTAVGCGLGLGGAAISVSDGQATGDEATALPESGAVLDAGADESSWSDVAGNADAADDGSDADAMATMDAMVSLDASAADAIPAAYEGGSQDTSDGPSDGWSDAADDGASTSACVSAVPSGWSLVIYDLGPDACPADYTAHDVSGSATLQTGACACACSVSQNGDCEHGMLTVHPNAGGNTGCNLDGGWSRDLNGSACTVVNGNLFVSGPHSDQVAPLAPEGGTCSDMAQTDPTKITTAAARYCDVPPSQADAVCNGTVPSGFAACIIASGETTCPSGTPFVHSYVVEDSAALQCSSCAGCSVTTTCSNITLTGFADTVCSSQNLVAQVGVDGGCNAVNLFTYPAPIAAVEYAAAASSSCTPGISAPSVQLANPSTICCR